MSIMLSVFGPTLAFYLFGLIFYTVVETGRSLQTRKAAKKAKVLDVIIV